jgi:hypothetical protein
MHLLAHQQWFSTITTPGYSYFLNLKLNNSKIPTLSFTDFPSKPHLIMPLKVATIPNTEQLQAIANAQLAKGP